jgi:hypothetical protein
MGPAKAGPFSFEVYYWLVALPTSRILLNKVLNRDCGQECVDWAVAMLERRMGGEFTARLAGMLPPHNHFQLAELRDRALEEIGAPHVQPDYPSIRRWLAECMDVAITDDDQMLDLVAIAIDVLWEHDASDLSALYTLHHEYDEYSAGAPWLPSKSMTSIINDIRLEVDRFIDHVRRTS